MASAGTLTVDLMMKTGSFETDSDRAARVAERNFKRVGKAANDAADDTEAAAKRTTNAMRMVGPQITDIVTQLQGGQNPITILTQQGGQLKDMFGGVGPAVSAVGTYIAGLINPLTLTAAAVAALGYAFYTGFQQAEAFNKALQISGNYAGQTQASIDGLAQSLGAGTGQVGKYRDILLDLVKSGQVAGENLQGFATAIADVSRLSGENADKVAADFVKMTDGVAKWAAEHNKQYHFITEAQYEHIARLEEEGKAQEAMELVARSLHEYLGKQAPEDIGFLTQAYMGWKQVIDGVVTSLQAVGRAQTNTEKIAGVYKELQDQTQRRDFFAGMGRDTSQLDQAIEANRQKLASLNQSILDEQAKADKKAADARTQQAGIDAQKWIDAQLKVLDKGYGKQAALQEARRKFADLVAANPNSDLAGGNTLAMLEAGIENKYKPPKEAKTPRTQLDRDTTSAQRLIQDLEAQVKAYGMGKDAVLDYKLALQGIPPELRKQAVALQGQLDALQAEDAFQKAVITGQNKMAQALTASVTQIATSLQTAAQTENALYAQRLKDLQDYGTTSAAALAEANQLTEAEQARHFMAMAKIAEQNQKDKDAFATASMQTDQTQLQGTQQFTDTLYGILKDSGQQNSILGKTLFYASKAMQVAQIIVAAETAAAMTQAGLTAAAATTAALAGPAAPAVFAGLEANAIGQAMVTRAIGYANAGLVAGLAIAGQRANGGPVEAGKQYIVGERGREAFIPNTSGMIVPNHVLERGSGETKYTIVNNTRGRIDTVTERRLSATERALIIDEAIGAVASDMSNPNGRVSRAQARNYQGMQRSR